MTLSHKLTVGTLFAIGVGLVTFGFKVHRLRYIFVGVPICVLAVVADAVISKWAGRKRPPEGD